MYLETTRFGAIEINIDAVITFTQPIIGFPQYRRFVLLPGPNTNNLYWLQSTESGDLAFLLMHPHLYVPDYKVELNAHDLNELAVEKATDIEVYTLLVVPADPAEIRTNLKAPLVINTRQRLGKQIVLEMSDYPIQFYLSRHMQETRERKEAINARTDT